MGIISLSHGIAKKIRGNINDINDAIEVLSIRMHNYSCGIDMITYCTEEQPKTGYDR